MIPPRVQRGGGGGSGGIPMLAAFLFALLINSVCHGQITRSVIEGGSVVLKCESEGQDQVAATVASASTKDNVTTAEQTIEQLQPTGSPIEWLHEDNLVINSTHTLLLGKELHISDVRRQQKGMYKCRPQGNLPSDQPIVSIMLNVDHIESVTVHRERDHQQNPLNPIYLRCKIAAHGPVAPAIWLKNGHKICADHCNSDASLQEKENLLRVIPKMGNYGEYACVTSNAAGSVVSRHNFTLNAVTKVWADLGDIVAHQQPMDPFAIARAAREKHGGRKHVVLRLKRGGAGGALEHSALHEVEARENEAAWLACEIGGGGKKKQQQQQQQQQQHPGLGHSVKWLKEGKLLRHTELVGAHAAVAHTTEASFSENGRPREDSRIVVNPRNATLHFTALFASDSGLYECHIYNDKEAQIGHKRSFLRVIEQLRFVPIPTSKNIELGSLAKVHCKVQGTPTPTVRWTKAGAAIPSSSADDINGTLVFRNVTAADRGNYTCEASSSQGVITADISIGVVVAPRFVVAPQGPIQAVELASVWMHCQATGDPMPTIQWDKDLVMVSGHSAAALASASADNSTTESAEAVDNPTSRYEVLANGTLYIREVHAEDEGKYGCTIGSSAGLKREEVVMTVRVADEYSAEEPGDGFMITRAVLITMSVAFAYIILVVGLMLWCRFRRQARKARLNLLDKDAIENGGTGGNGDLKMCEIEPCLPADRAKKMNGHGGKRSADGSSSAAAAAAAMESNNDTAASSNSKLSKKSTNFDQITIPRTSLIELQLVGQGDFGDVFVGKIRARDIRKDLEAKVAAAADTVVNEKSKSKQSLNEINEIREASGAEEDAGDSNSLTRNVLVKALNRVKDEAVCIEFRRQIEMFRAVSHRSVCKLYGLVRDKDPHLLVLENTDLGDLKQYLGKPRNGSASHPLATPTTVQLLQLAWQVGRGMDAIYRARYIHKDLAARNCLLSSALDVKISYGGLNREAAAGATGGGDYRAEYARHNNATVPIRWMAPECLHDDDYSTKSDVYAFGVLVWELFSAGQAALPLAELGNEEFVQRLRDGKLERTLAEGTPKELHTMLLSCWSTNPKERPSFHTLHTAIANCLQTEKSKEATTPAPASPK